MKRKISSQNDKLEDLKAGMIRKNSSVDIGHTIKKIQLGEKRLAFILGIFIFVAVCLTSYFVLNGINTKEDYSSLGPLRVAFSNNDDGMGDIVSLTEMVSNIDGGSFKSYETDFKVINNSSTDSHYAVYLENYIDQEEYDGCFNKIIDHNNIYFSIDGSLPTTLSSVDYNGGYLIAEGLVFADSETSHTLQVWSSDNGYGHYHGKIVVKFVN